MGVISAKDAAKKWGVPQRQVAALCAGGHVPDAVMVGNMWMLPRDAENPLSSRGVPYLTSDSAVKPFLKWAGGKGQLLHEIEAYYPFADGKITKYAEPFVGGGAVLFDILSKYDLDEVYISDVNAELINTYRVIRDDVHSLIQILAGMQHEFIPLDAEGRKGYYLARRERFNALKVNGHEAVNIEKAALMIFLNKTCFNGLYRVNKSGLFNVPMGAYKAPMICDERNLRAASEKLQKVHIRCGDYNACAPFVDERTFVYFDPPYRPISATANFTAYTENAFCDEAQIALAEFVGLMAAKGAKILVSNSDPKNSDAEDDFFENLYASFQIKRVDATRMINSNSAARGKVKELLISNFRRSAAMARNFNDWLSTFRESIADYGYYTDFPKVYRNVDAIRVELHILNSLIGSQNIEADFESLVGKYPEILPCIPVLLAVRARQIYAIDSDGEFTYDFKRPNQSIAQYKAFMRKTGLFDLMERHIIHSLVDYVTGVEAGLDSNGRKNRGGHLMEHVVEGYIQKSGLVKDKDYFKEMGIRSITELWGIDLSAVSNKGKTEKRFDFVVKTEKQLYLIEANCYLGQGSKLNETARSYKQISQEVDAIDGVTFVWFTDGAGWRLARHNLEETFDAMPHIYNIHDMERGIMDTLFL